METKITVNKKIYLLKSEVDKQIASLQQKLKNKKDDYVNNKYKQKYEQLNVKYRTLYMKYKHQSDRMAENRIKYVSIIHQLQCKIINQSDIEELIKTVDKMAEIEKNI